MLDFNHTYKTKYCIPYWLRDEQIRQAIKRVSKRIQPHELRGEGDDEIAIVGYGPTLRDTWEEIRGFKYVMSCSGAHRFLIDRGIVPTWHAAVDPLKGHTVKLIGEPHPEVEYLIASTCHADVFDHLEGKNVTLWHVFDGAEDAIRVLPRGEVSLLGGCDVGMRCLTLSRLLGFRKMHLFGIDGAYPEGKARHAGDHPVALKGERLDYKGRTFFTTCAMLESAKQVFHELDQLPDVEATFHGDSLVQHMAKFIERKPLEVAAYAHVAPEVISASYVALNRRLHESNLTYGVGGGKHAPVVLKLVEGFGRPNVSVLDYGCGKGYLQRELPFPIWEYDPAIAGKETPPRPADLVVCTDVLEHIEPDKLVWVLSDLARVTRAIGYFVIHTGASSKTLEDGRNAHLIQRQSHWWMKTIGKFFVITRVIEKAPLVHVFVSPKPKKKPNGVAPEPKPPITTRVVPEASRLEVVDL